MRLLGLHVLWWLCIVLLEYHVSEVLLVLWTSSSEFEFPATLLLSREYMIAMAFALVVEFPLWSWYFVSAQNLLGSVLCPLGLLLVVIGECIRKCAWLTAGFAFTHRIKTVKRPGHILVKNGVYSFSRHPGYLGWLIWVVGTQLLIANPVSAVLFALVAWQFFRQRIPYEEFYLAKMFGDDFICYRSKVPTRIPAIP